MNEDISFDRTAVVGLGAMGAGIARVLSAAGHDVVVADSSVDEAGERLAKVRDRVASDVSLNRCASDDLAHVERIEVARLDDAVRDASLVVEAVPESWAIKEAVLASISAAAPVAVIASNTSSFPIQRLAAGVVDPTRMLGVHFFNPADLVPGVEVVPTDVTSPHVVSSVLAMLRGAGKVPVVVRDSPGFVANRLQLALFVEAMACVDEGLIDAHDLDTLVRETVGFRLPAYGPFEVADMAGLDVYAAILDTLRAAFGERFVTPTPLADLVAQGRHGVKTNAGFGVYPAAELESMLRRRDADYRAIAHALGSPRTARSRGTDPSGTSSGAPGDEVAEKG